ncbi:hypothetical protein SBOR_8456 [Sclerotinia borealis F-4128]|uniref:Uncharacterized protein n=1 Tax=Sclerotinia borealis (strain F-4128) TaxID=1432307 RepID=W9C2Z0_SCLBF|nr:hypothetical protein SBOR_8456 [Sclerotinia borealis F-4128]
MSAQDVFCRPGGTPSQRAEHKIGSKNSQSLTNRPFATLLVFSAGRRFEAAHLSTIQAPSLDTGLGKHGMWRPESGIAEANLIDLTRPDAL